KKRPFDTSDAGQVEDRKRASQAAEERRAKEVREVLSTRGGRAFVWRILGKCGVYHSAPEGSEAMSRFEGRRDVGIQVLKECLTSDPKVYILMQQEAADRDSEEERHG
ncbi:hypothetical protein LCGC14_3101320, partial [marine sediment metagenome]